MIFVLLVFSRLLLFLGAFIAQRTVPYLGFFPYKELLVGYHLPSWVSAFANFDGIHYLLIAKQGYSQWEQAFFPLYPLFVRMISFIIPNYLVSALFISHISFVIGLIFFQKLLKNWGVKIPWAIFFLLSFPTAFFFGAVYTEGLFFMFLILSLFFLEKKNYLLAGMYAALSSSTRLIGTFLFVPFLFSFLEQHGSFLKQSIKCIKQHILFLFSPLIGLFSYMFYLWLTVGDPLFFFNSQPIFGANRSTHLIFLPQVYYRYLKILFTAAHDFRWYMSLLEISIFSIVFAVLVFDLTRIVKKFTQKDYIFFGINIFSLANLLLPTLTGTFSSVPRYALFSLSFFLYLGQLKSRGLKIGILVAFVTLQIILLSLFIQGYFVG